MNKEFIQALDEIEREKGVSRDIVFDALEKALEKSYEKNFNDRENVLVNIDRDSGDIRVLSQKIVVSEVEDDILQINLEDARKISNKAELGDTVSVEVTPDNFGRIAAQTARNIVIQKIKDAERDAIYDEFLDRENELVTAKIQRIDRGNVYVDLGNAEGIMLPQDQVKGEDYKINERIKVYIYEVKNSTKGPQILVSRSNSGLVRRLFELEVPEIADGTVEIYNISREAGSRSKIAVFSENESVDPVGSCVGYKGQRVNSIVDALDGEKIDIIIYSKDIKTFISNSLSPSEVLEVRINEPQNAARVIVPDDQLSLAIGKEGQNVRLAAKLTGWKIDINGKSKQEELEAQGLDDFEVVEKKFGKREKAEETEGLSALDELDQLLKEDPELHREGEGQREKFESEGQEASEEDSLDEGDLLSKDEETEEGSPQNMEEDGLGLINGFDLDQLKAAMTDLDMDEEDEE